jgi:hypothetical protein
MKELLIYLFILQVIKLVSNSHLNEHKKYPSFPETQRLPSTTKNLYTDTTPTYAIVTYRKVQCKSNFAQPWLNIHVVNYIFMCVHRK